MGVQEVQKQVAALYNRFPYPNYPLLARPRWQDGFLTSSYFAGRLVAQGGPSHCGHGAHQAPRGDVLVAGCGEMLPYVIRKWEPASAIVSNVDLSRRSLSRGRFRTLFCRGRSEFHEGDIVEFLDGCARGGRTFAHIETFGMLHHMEDPVPAIQAMARQLLPGGTIRVMVYNSPARQWIHALQDYFTAVMPEATGTDALAATRQARQILEGFAAVSPLVADRLRAIGPGTMRNPARLADTFLHPHELRWPVERWFREFTNAGLRLAGVFDRYAELDDLPNPMWQCYAGATSQFAAQLATQLAKRAADRRFEGNLEMIWTRPGEPAGAASNSPRTAAHLGRLKFRGPPHIWFDFEETRHLSIKSRLQIWHAFLDATRLQHKSWGGDDRTLQRLARLGAIMPDQLDAPLTLIAAQKMEESMSSPDLPSHRPLARAGDTGPHATAIRRLDDTLGRIT